MPLFCTLSTKLEIVSWGAARQMTARLTLRGIVFRPIGSTSPISRYAVALLTERLHREGIYGLDVHASEGVTVWGPFFAVAAAAATPRKTKAS